MTVGKFFLYLFLFIIAAPFLFVGVLLLDRFYINTYRFNYRLTVEVEVDGQVKSGSSIYGIIATTKSRLTGPWPFDNTNPQAGNYGVAPIIELGRRGTLVAAQEFNHPHYWKYREARGLPDLEPPRDPIRPLDPTELVYAAYTPGKSTVSWPEPHRTLVQQRNRIQSKRMPQFIWIPPSGNFREARQLMPDQFAEVIGPGVKLKAVWIEPAWVFWVPTSYDKMPKWLDDNIAWLTRPNQPMTETRPEHEFRLYPDMIVGSHWR